MPPEFITPATSVAGTIIVAILAGIISYAAGKGMKRHEWRLNMRRESFMTRQRLFSELLIETDKAILRSLDEKFSHPSEFHDLSKRFSELELLADNVVVTAAKALYDEVLHAHVRGEGRKSNYNERKQAFIAAARLELAALER